MEAAPSHFLPGEGPSRGLLRDCTTSPINRFAALLNIWLYIINITHPPLGLLLLVRRVHADDQDLGLHRPHHLFLAEHPGMDSY